MSVLINYKICDNAKECGGIAVCPTGAIYWAEEAVKIEVDSLKCTCCKACLEACPVGAIHIAENEEEYQKIKSEIEKDIRERKELFVDRYGSTPIDESLLLAGDRLEAQLKAAKGVHLVEFFNEESIECLLKSIPVSNIINTAGGCAAYKKLEADDSLCSKFEIENLPALLVFDDGSLIGKIDGYYDTSQQISFISELMNILKLRN